MMKKIGMLCIACLLALSGCSTKAPAIEPEGKQDELIVDVLVIGAGGAGMSAAIEAADAGAKVMVLEKMPFAGGNTVRSKGGLNAAETSVQATLGIEDSIQTFYDDTMTGGKSLNDPELVKYFSENSAEAVDWLTSIGMDLSDVAPGAGATNPRMHRPEGGPSIGPILVNVLSENLEKRNIEIKYNTEAYELIEENNTVVGVKAKTNNEDFVIKADAVILATGGFAANEEMFTKYRPDLAGFITTNHAGATGDGIRMAEALGAALVDVDQIQTNPTVEQDTKEVISESIRGLGAIFVNQEGVRFTSEMLTRDVLSAKILEQTGKYAYIIFDQNLRENMKAVEENIKKGIVVEGESIEALATQIEMDPKVLEETIMTWNESVANQSDTLFQRDTGMDADLSKAPYYAIKVGPGVHYTMGGIKINTNTEVMKEDGKIIAGLYAAGEVTGGVHGANRLGGNAVADIIIFGRQAGIKAAEYALANGSLMSEADQPKTEDVLEIGQGNFSDGTYSATTKGNNGDITIEVVVKDKSMISIQATKHEETGPIFEAVEKNLFPMILNKQSSEVDTIAGATVSSKAVLEAVTQIIEQAK